MLCLECKGQDLRFTTNEKIASGFINVNVVKFSFCERWSGMVKTAQFTQRQGLKTKTYNVLIDDLAGTAAMPNEVVAGDLLISAFGVDPDTGMRITTTIAVIKVEPSGFTPDGDTPIPPTPDLYAQLIATIHKTALPHIGDNGNWWFDDQDTGVSATAEIIEAQGKAIREIETKGAATLASIPDDYSAMGADVSQLKDTIAYSSNLVDHSTISNGLYIASDGTIDSDSKYAISDYIKIEPSAVYIGSSLVSVAYYNQDKAFIRRSYVTNEKTFTAPSNAHYLRISSNIAIRRWQLNKGDTLFEYDAHYKYLNDGMRLPYEATASKDAIIFSSDIDHVFCLNDVPAVDFGDYIAIRAAEVYALYDSLMANNSSYITKEVLGNDASGNEIAAYRMTPARAQVRLVTGYDEDDKPEVKIPTVFVCCGLHGYEHSSALVMYLLLKEMCEKWSSDELLSTLRHDVNFIVIPVANPSGWNAYTRKNAAGIDLNRNFEYGFSKGSPGSSTYGDETPLSQPETQYIRKILDENNIDVAIDFHETASSSAVSANDICWISATRTYDLHIAMSFIERISRKFKAEYDWANAVDAMHGYAVYDPFMGSLADDAVATGCKFATTFEIISRWQLYEGSAAFDAIHAKTSVECFGGYILSILRQLQREYHQMSDYLRA